MWSFGGLKLKNEEREDVVAWLARPVGPRYEWHEVRLLEYSKGIATRLREGNVLDMCLLVPYTKVS